MNAPDMESMDAPQASGGQHQVAHSARIIALATLSSRLLGAVRDVLTAYYFGAGMLVDAFVIAFVIPNLFRRLLGEGALSSAFLPVYADYVENRSRREADRMASNIFCIVGLVLLVLVFCGYCSSIIFDATAEDGSRRQLISRLLMVLLPYMFFICLTAVCQAVLNTHKHFLAPALAPLVLNVFWIAGLLLAGRVQGEVAGWQRIFIVAGTILIGGIVQLTMQFPVLRKYKFKFTFHFDFKDEGFRRILTTMLPIVVGIGVLQINSVLDNVIALKLVPGDGPVSYLYYANRLLQFPLSIIGMAMAVAAFPTFSRHFARKEWDALHREILKALRVTFFLAFPATVGLVIIRVPLIHLLFGHGEFASGGGETVMRASRVVLFYAIGVWAHCLVQVLMRVFYGIGDAKTPFRIAGYMVAFNLCLNLLLIPHFQEAGLALATSVSGILMLLLLCWRLRSKIRISYTPSFWLAIMKSVLSGVLMGTACIAVIHGIGDTRLDTLLQTPAGQAIAVAAVFVPAVLVYGLCSLLWQRDELSAVLRR
ncbi:murein biosynthesis integral membrane protein MurJ [Planctomycetota bacterium]